MSRLRLRTLTIAGAFLSKSSVSSLVLHPALFCRSGLEAAGWLGRVGSLGQNSQRCFLVISLSRNCLNVEEWALCELRAQPCAGRSSPSQSFRESWTSSLCSF